MTRQMDTNQFAKQQTMLHGTIITWIHTGFKIIICTHTGN